MTATTGHLRFALASCAYPPGLLDGPMAKRAEDALLSLDALPEFLIFTGDQIYVDATAGIFDPARDDLVLEDLWRDDVVRKRNRFETAFIRIHSMLDDHEIVDNWEPEASSDTLAQYDEACIAFAVACRRAPGPGYLPLSYQPGTPLWYDFTHPSGHRFFIADSRTTRSPRNSASLETAKILDDRQWQALSAWLRDAPADRLSFLVCPSIVLPRRLTTAQARAAALLSDAWDGYPASLHALLALLHEIDNPRVVFLSGDEHISCAADFSVARAGQTSPVNHWCSLHAPAMFAPYPFANGSAWNFAQQESFHFGISSTKEEFVCAVTCEFPPPDNGFVVIDVALAAGQTALTAAFHSAEDPLRPPRLVCRHW